MLICTNIRKEPMPRPGKNERVVCRYFVWLLSQRDGVWRADGRSKADTVRRALIRDVLMPLAEKFPTPEGEIGFADGRLHSFRHFFCSLCALRGIDQQVVMQWLGHRDSKVVRALLPSARRGSQKQMKRITLNDEEAAGAQPAAIVLFGAGELRPRSLLGNC